MDDLLKRSALQQLATLLTGEINSNPQHTYVVCSICCICMYGAEQNLEQTHISELVYVSSTIPLHHFTFFYTVVGGETR